MRKIILASASPRRRELLTQAGVTFSIIPAHGEEKRTSDEPGELGECEEKTLVIGSDTVVVFQNRILGKPADEEDAVHTLQKLQDNTHQVYTGVTVLEKKQGQWIEHTFYEKTDVEFYPVSENEIKAYVSTGEPMDKAGSYGIQGRWGIYVKGICGDYNNVVGLPVARLFHEMKKLGISLVD